VPESPRFSAPSNHVKLSLGNIPVGGALQLPLDVYGPDLIAGRQRLASRVQYFQKANPGYKFTIRKQSRNGETYLFVHRVPCDQEPVLLGPDDPCHWVASLEPGGRGQRRFPDTSDADQHFWQVRAVVRKLRRTGWNFREVSKLIDTETGELVITVWRAE